MKHQLFFELLKTVIGQRKVLLAVPSAKEWEAIYGLFFLSRSIFFEKCATTCARIYTTYARIAAIRALMYKNADFCIKINTYFCIR